MRPAPTRASGCNLTQADNSASIASAEPLIENHLPNTTGRESRAWLITEHWAKPLTQSFSHSGLSCCLWWCVRRALRSKPLCSLHTHISRAFETLPPWLNDSQQIIQNNPVNDIQDSGAGEIYSFNHSDRNASICCWTLRTDDRVTFITSVNRYTAWGTKLAKPTASFNNSFEFLWFPDDT